MPAVDQRHRSLRGDEAAGRQQRLERRRARPRAINPAPDRIGEVHGAVGRHGEIAEHVRARIRRQIERAQELAAVQIETEERGASAIGAGAAFQLLRGGDRGPQQPALGIDAEREDSPVRARRLGERDALLPVRSDHRDRAAMHAADQPGAAARVPGDAFGHEVGIAKPVHLVGAHDGSGARGDRLHDPAEAGRSLEGDVHRVGEQIFLQPHRGVGLQRAQHRGGVPETHRGMPDGREDRGMTRDGRSQRLQTVEAFARLARVLTQAAHGGVTQPPFGERGGGPCQR